MPLIRRPESPAGNGPDPVSGCALESASADERWSAVRALADTPETAATLVRMLGVERDPRVLEAIFTALARSDAPDAADALVGCVRSDDAVVRTGAMDALRAAPERLASRLPALLGDRDPDVRILACDLARAVPQDLAAPLLCARLEAETELNVCAAAVETLAEIGDEAAAPCLAACAERFAHEPFLKFAAAEAARRLSARPAGPRG